MRFDYHGTGDSEGCDEEPRRLDTWRANICDAVAWLKRETGCRFITLIGLRIGATLVCLQAQEHAVDNLVLWEPVIRGKRFVRELSALSLTASLTTDNSGNLEAAGFVYTKETVESLSQLDLLNVSPLFARGLVVRRDQGQADTSLADHLRKLGRNVEQVTLPGYDEMMAEPQDTKVPEEAIANIARWLAKSDPQQTGNMSSVKFKAEALMTHDAAGIRESVRRISARPDIFGIATEPVSCLPTRPWIVLLNGGAAYRIGPNRLYVQLARRLAALGFPNMRVDITGIGDSEADAGREENDTYSATAVRDVAVICDCLRQLQPARPIVLMGLCSGAYASFQAAAQLPHKEITESILLNPLTFFWRDGMTLSTSPTQHLQAWHYYRRLIFDWGSWRKLLTGKTNLGFRGSLKRFSASLFRKRQEASESKQAHATTGPLIYSHPARDNLSGDLTRVEAFSRKLAMFISENDPGYYLLMHKARRKANALIRSGDLRCFFVEKADHTFSTSSSREALCQLLASHLCERYGAGPERAG